MKAWWAFVVQKLAAPPFRGWAPLFRSRTLSRRLLAPVIPGVIIVTFLFGSASYLLVRHQIVRSVRQVMAAEAQNTARTLEGFFQQRLNDLDSVSETTLIADYNKNRGFGLGQEAAVYRRELEKYFKNFAQRAKVYYDISYVSADGQRVCSLRSAIAPERYKASFPLEFIDHLRKGKKYDPPLQQAVEGGPLVKRYAKPVFDETGVFLGAIVTDCDMAAVEDILRGVQVGVGGGAFVEDFDGKRVLGLERSKANSIFRGEMLIRESDGLWRWRVVVTAPAREYLGRPLRNILLLTVLISIVGTLGLVGFIVHRVSDLMEPIHSMVEGTKRFASGDLTFRFPSFKSRELDVLAASFNRMAETLEARNRELEQRLRQVTALRDMEEAVIQRQEEETESPHLFGGGGPGVLF
ncbi:MAG: HAMP domain-containing protein [Elusimicrobia bacterium]|nr:HAMP domain-containing protein [Elusimicrobiota bacterium]